MRLIHDDAWGIMTVYQEAAGEPYEGKLAVAEVIRNRAEQKYQSDGTIAGTVLWPLQFSGWNAKDPNRIPAATIDDEMPAVQECMKAWFEAKTTNITQGALLYYNPRLAKPAWDFTKLIPTVTIGQHDFYRLKP